MNAQGIATLGLGMTRDCGESIEDRGRNTQDKKVEAHPNGLASVTLSRAASGRVGVTLGADCPALESGYTQALIIIAPCSGSRLIRFAHMEMNSLAPVI
jgi:hypothetical protein